MMLSVLVASGVAADQERDEREEGELRVVGQDAGYPVELIYEPSHTWTTRGH